MAITCKIDYLDFSMPDYKRQSYFEYLGTEVCWLDRGFRGYKESGMLSHGGKYAMTIGREDGHFSLNSKALGHYIHDYDRFSGLVKKVFEDKGNVSRVDLAFDVIDDLKFVTVLRAVKNGLLVSKSRQIQIVEKFENIKDGKKELGTTIYVGSKKSHKMLRIYDKAKEQRKDGDHVRFELQLRDEAAMKALEQFVKLSKEEAGEFILGMVKGFVDFRKNDNENVTRRTRMKWYDKIMKQVNDVKLVFDKLRSTISSLVEWVDRQVAPTLALFKRHFGDGFGSILDYILINGDARLREKHFELLRI